MRNSGFIHVSFCMLKICLRVIFYFFVSLIPRSFPAQAALDFAYILSSDIARQRFDDKGITMNIPDDLEAPTGPLFVESRLDFSFDRE